MNFLAQQHLLAQSRIGKGVAHIIEGSLEEAQKKEALFMGVKNTPAIKAEWLELLSSKFVPHTADSMAHKGRAVDADLINPLTLRAMTGSSSGTAVNVLLGVNHLGLGTDGGGSVIYPAMAVNLYSVMLAGAGFTSGNTKASTDGIEFRSSLGLMSFTKEPLLEALNLLLPRQKSKKPDFVGGDKEALKALGVEGEICLLPDTDERAPLIKALEEAFKRYHVLIFREEFIDVYGYGDSVLGFCGEESRKNQKLAGKKAGKVLNMLGASAFTLPCTETASGYIIAARNGIDALCMARYIFENTPEMRTPLFLDYFGPPKQ